ncbi:hypothetical protein FOA52_014545 [Chlamydomonas sp. UWO 241]|nr:hypothetical protein FOA52_014545 [Chlamydomonas sp. UWO 241]
MATTSNPYATPLFLAPRPEPAPGPRTVLNQGELEALQHAFSTLDSDQTGFVTRRQIKVALRAMGFPAEKADVADALMRSGAPDAEAIDFGVFQRVVGERLLARTPQEEMLRAFQLFDVHGAGKIDAFTLRRVTKSLGMDISEEELSDMITEFDLDKDGMISQAEFMNVMTLMHDE